MTFNADEYSIYVSVMLYAAAPIRISVMDRRVVLGASDAGLLAAIAVAYADWPRAGQAGGPAIQLALELGQDAGDGTPLEIAVDGPRLRLSGAGLSGWADARSLAGFCRIPPSLADRADVLAAQVIDTLLLFLLTRWGRTPLHAAGIVLGETALALAGPSGSGKSTLSLAAMARGLRILSDDTLYIQLQPALRIWGFPRPLHVFPADAPRFTQGTRLRGGKLKAAVSLPAWPGPPVADRAALVLLERGVQVRLEPLQAAEAVRALSRLEPGFDLLAQESAAATAAVAAAGAWRLVLSRDPAEAIDALIGQFAPATASA